MLGSQLQIDLPSEILKGRELNLLGRRITCMTGSEIIESIQLACSKRRQMLVANYNVHSFNVSMQLPWFYEFMQTADIVHCDGLGMLKAIGFMGVELPIDYRVSYTLLMPQLLEHCHQNRYSIFLLGAKPEILQASLDNLRLQYPGLRVAGHHGYFSVDDPNQNEQVIEQINHLKPQILIVGMGVPRQENWIRVNRHRLAINVIMAGGAVIDRLGGYIPDCPTMLSNIGLEWFFRLCLEPKRMAARYLLGNPAFVLHMAFAKAQGLTASTLDNWRHHHGHTQKAEGGAEHRIVPPSRYSSDYASPHKPIGTYLIEAGLLTPTDVEIALADQQLDQIRFGDILVKRGWIKRDTLEYLVEKVILPDRLAKATTMAQPRL